jgi:hypothetical protein
VAGLAEDPSTGIMYAVNGTQIYTVNTANATLTPLFDSGHGLGVANGTAFLGEATAAPEPASLAVLGVGLLGLGFVVSRKRQ